MNSFTPAEEALLLQALRSARGLGPGSRVDIQGVVAYWIGNNILRVDVNVPKLKEEVA